MHDRRFRLERIVEPALVGRARHELGNPCAPLGLTACGLNRLSFQIRRTKGIGGRPAGLGLLLHDRTDDIHEGLGPASATPASLAPASTPDRASWAADGAASRSVATAVRANSDSRVMPSVDIVAL